MGRCDGVFRGVAVSWRCDDVMRWWCCDVVVMWRCNHQATIMWRCNQHATTIELSSNHHVTTIPPSWNHHATITYPPCNLHVTSCNHHAATPTPVPMLRRHLRRLRRHRAGASIPVLSPAPVRAWSRTGLRLVRATREINGVGFGMELSQRHSNVAPYIIITWPSSETIV